MTAGILFWRGWELIDISEVGWNTDCVAGAAAGSPPGPRSLFNHILDPHVLIRRRCRSPFGFWLRLLCSPPQHPSPSGFHLGAKAQIRTTSERLCRRRARHSEASERRDWERVGVGVVVSRWLRGRRLGGGGRVGPQWGDNRWAEQREGGAAAGKPAAAGGGRSCTNQPPTKTNTSSSPESIEIEDRPRLYISKDEKSKILSPYSPDRDQTQ